MHWRHAVYGADQIGEEQASALAKELSELSQQQSEALQSSIYMGMSNEEAAAYDKRAERITELCRRLGRYRRL